MNHQRVLGQSLAIEVGASIVLVAALGVAGTQPRPIWFVAMALAIGFGSVAVRLLVPNLIETFWPQRDDETLAPQRMRSNDRRTHFLATWGQESDRGPRAGEGSQASRGPLRPPF